MAAVALTIWFALELNAIAAVAIWGFRAGDGGITGAAYAAAAIVVLVVNWALFIAPRSTRSPIPIRWRTPAGAVVMLLAALLLAVAGEPLPAVAFAVIVVADLAALFALGAVDAEWPIASAAAPPGVTAARSDAAAGARSDPAGPAPAGVRAPRSSAGGTKRRKRR